MRHAPGRHESEESGLRATAETEALVENVADLGVHRAETAAGREAYLFLSDGEEVSERLTWGALDESARAQAVRLGKLGVEEGDRVLLLFPPGLEFVTAFFGTIYAGAIAVPSYPPRRSRGLERLEAVVRIAEPRLALHGFSNPKRVVPALERVTEGRDVGCERAESPAKPEASADKWRRPRLNPDSVAFLQFTSGSTATPKGVAVTHGNLLHNEHSIRRAFRQGPDSVVVSWLPVYHDMGLIGGLLQALWSGGRSVLMSPMAFLRKPMRWLRAIDRYRADTSGGPNFAYDLCARKVDDEQVEGIDLSCWQVAFNGAEPVRAATLDRFAERFGPHGFRRRAFVPCYGLAEATLLVSAAGEGEPRTVAVHAGALEEGCIEAAARSGSESRRLVSCGPPVPEQRVEVVDPERRQALAAGAVGEIWVAGPSVAPRYWERREDSEETFGGYLADGSGPFLRTGDLGFSEGDELFVTGRLKDLIILRGRNLYPQDVERSVERCHPVLRPGGGAAFTVAADDGKRLVVVHEVERGSDPDPAMVAGLARQAVAETHEASLDELVLIRAGRLPRTTSGKVRRGTCRQRYLGGELAVVGSDRLAAGDADSPEREEVPLSREAVLAETGVERARLVAALVRSRVAASLEVAPGELSEDVPLTAQGLDSLRALELRHALLDTLEVDLPGDLVLSGADLERVTRTVLEGLEERPEVQAPEPSTGGSKAGTFRLSYGQRALWFLNRLDPSSSAYNLANAFRLPPDTDPEALVRAIRLLVQRHAALRATFWEDREGPRQRVGATADLDVALADTTTWSPDRRRRKISWVAHRSFDLETGPLVRVRLLRVPAEREHPSAHWILLLVIHHIAADFWSLGQLLRELALAYGAEVDSPGTGGERLAPQLLDYPDYVSWERERLEGEEGQRLWRFWRSELAPPLPVLELPTDRPRPPVQTFRGAACRLRLGAAASRELRELGKTRGATGFAVSLALFAAYLSRVTGQDELVLGAPTAGRSMAELGGLVGYLVNPVPIRIDAGGDPSFRELLDRTQEASARAIAHRDFPLVLLADRLRPERTPDRPPLFQAMLVHQTVPPGAPEELSSAALNFGGRSIDQGALKLQPLPVEPRFSQVELALWVAELEGTLALELRFNTDLFNPTTARRMLRHLSVLAGAVTAEPAAELWRLPILTKAERLQLLGEWSRPNGPPSVAEPVHAGFVRRAMETPDAVAVADDRERWSYRALARRMDAVARALRRRGIGPEDRVGLMLERSPAMVATVLGVLQSGAAYVPLDPEYPEERVSFIADDAAVDLIVVSGRSATSAAGGADGPGDSTVRVGELETEGSDASRRSPGPCPAGPHNLAYVIYTSGSTGRPKGVAVEHRSAATLVRWAQGAFDDSLAGVLTSTSLNFDLSVFEIFAPLAYGSTVFVVGSALELPRLRCRHEVTLVNTVPSVMTELVRRAELPDSVTTVNLAGEPLQRILVDTVYGAGSVSRVINLYGPSEDTTYSTCAVVDSRSQGEPTIGVPVAGSRVYVLDPWGNPVPQGVPGELHLGGDGLARCYLGRPGRTAAAWIPDALSGESGSRLYRTGDLVRFGPRGRLEFLGRIDQQLKLRGFRIEPGEIESALVDCGEVREAAVVPRSDPAGDRRLVAYVVPEDRAVIDPGTLSEGIGERLPAYMVPELFVPLDELPLTPNGKIDRRALPEPEWQRTRPVSREPESPTEELLAQVFQELLGRESVDVEEGFFAAGGNSLKASRLIARIRSELGVDLPLGKVFEAPSVAELAELVERERGRPGGSLLPPVEPVERGETLPMSYGQQRLWLFDRINSGSPAYVMPGRLRLNGSVVLSALTGALVAIRRRHEILRTNLVEVDGEPRQRLRGRLNSALPVVDLSHLEEERRAREAGRVAREQGRRPFDLEEDPLLRTLLLRLADERHHLLCIAHHAVADGPSLAVFCRELAELYEIQLGAASAALDPLPVQYGDFAVWQRRHLSPEALAEPLELWRHRLEGIEPLRLPVDGRRPQEKSFLGATVSVLREDPLADRVRRLSRREGVTPFMTLLGAFTVVMSRYSGQSDLPIGTPAAGRVRAELDGLIGFFVNLLVLRIRHWSGTSFRELLTAVREITLEAFELRSVPFELLAEEVGHRRSLARQNPLVQVCFVHEDRSEPQRAGGMELRPEAIDNGTAKFDLTLFSELEERSLRLALEYSTDLYEQTYAERLLSHLQVGLEAVVEEPELRLAAVPIMSGREKRQILDEWNTTDLDLLERQPVHRRFEEQARWRPEAVAVVGPRGRAVTYGELDRRAEALAMHLRSLGLNPGAAVAVLLDRSPELVEALLGVLKAGGAYVPLDPNYPPRRISHILDASGTPVLITRRGMEPDHQEDHLGYRTLFVGQIPNDPERVDGPSGSAPVPGRRRAYLIFTSGSTGRPKGVTVEHRSLCNLVDWHRKEYGVNNHDRASVLAGLGFDAFVWELWPYLSIGACIYFVPPELRSASSELVHWLTARGISISFAPTPLAESMLDSSMPPGMPLQFLLTGGDRLTSKPPDDLPFYLVNHYGPTEATVVTTWTTVDPERSGVCPPPIGEPIANTQVLVLTDDLRLQPHGLLGEICISGVGLSRGYLGSPGRTAERFVPNPYGEPGSRLYRTGDLGRFLPDGKIEFSGRIDRQVQVRGFRVELAEVEAVLGGHPKVKEAVVSLQQTGATSADQRLLAYFVVGEESAPAPGELRDYLEDRLPTYMVPVAFVELDEIPLTAHGKVDREALPVPEGARPELREEYVAPRSSLEEMLAELWANVLHLDRVGIHDDFFDLGGQSLIATKLMSAVHDVFGLRLSPRELFENPTVARMAPVVVHAMIEAADADSVEEAFSQMAETSDSAIAAS